MRIAPALAFSVFSVWPCAADTWDIMYLSGGGQVQVAPEKAEQIDAYVMSLGRGDWLLGLSCTHVRLGNGQPDLPPTNSSGEAVTELLASFDGDRSTRLGAFGYYGGSYAMPYQADLVERLSNSQKLKISEPVSGFEVTFSLDGFAQAYDNIRCAGEKQ